MKYFATDSTSAWGRYLCITLLIPFFGMLVFFLFIWMGTFGPLPGTGELTNISQQQASEVYSSDGEMLGTYYFKNRTTVPLEEINPMVVDALLSIEDIRFYEHNGVDTRAMARVLVKSILLGQEAGGGSTISMQLAKNLYPRHGDGIMHLAADKVREIIIARRIEEIYSKDEILELYLNTVSFGENIYGIELASKRFFNKSPTDLEIHEAATLAGMLRATTWYNPRRNPERSMKRRNLVIHQMEKYGMIESAGAKEAKNKPLLLDYNRSSSNEGLAPYFRERLRSEVQYILNNETALDGETYNLYTDGLTIQTTLDSRVQKAAEQAVQTHMPKLQEIFNRQQQTDSVFTKNDPAILFAWQQSDKYKQLKQKGVSEEELNEAMHAPDTTKVFTWDGYEEKFLSPYEEITHNLSILQAGFLAMHPETGDVLAWVGGINHDHFQYDHVTSTRQMGSAFKPVLYSAALEAGKEPCDYQRNMLSSYEAYDGWTPKNISEEYGGRYSLQAALAHSINTVAVDLIMDTGIHHVQNTARRMGISSDIPAEPSIALGSANVSLMELTTAYTTFLNSGKPAEPKSLIAIYNSEGELIYDFTDEEDNQTDHLVINAAQNNTEVKSQQDTTASAISSETAAAMVNMLIKTVNEGTGSSLRTQFNITHALAGKTGTTQNFSDGWFIGMTPEMVFGAWVGGSVPRVHLSNNMGYASQTALPIAGHFLNRLNEHKDLEPQQNQFYPDQVNTAYSLACDDYRKDKIHRRVLDFFKGKDSDEPRIIEEEKEEGRSIGDRIKGFFTGGNSDRE